ncbi:hypothetical protein [Novosphingobium sp. ERN07]|uniref:hypothetical protein n=1 Tax=Novosphingobium sp. ERN07 TaxID=2726187 RepID=UPI001456BAF7|nr:hypothetical protein [Novosphingobium sp. ERN07]
MKKQSVNVGSSQFRDVLLGTLKVAEPVPAHRSATRLQVFRFVAGRFSANY